MSLHVQFLTLFSMIGCGAIIGTLLDAYRVCAIELKWKRWIKYASDMIFWIIAAFIVILTLQRINNGQIHIYVFAAIAVGYYSYAISIRRFVMKRVRKLIFFTRKCIRILRKIIYMIIVKPILFLYKIGYALFIGFFLLLFQIVLIIVKPIRFLGIWLWGRLVSMAKWTLGKLGRKKKT